MSQREYLSLCRTRYKKLRSRNEKNRFLDEICATTGYNRKYLLRYLNRQGSKPKSKKAGRKRIYGAAELKVLKEIWRKGGYPCSKRLKAMLPVWLPKYKNHYPVSEETEKKLLKKAAVTMDRLLCQARSSADLSSRCSTK